MVFEISANIVKISAVGSIEDNSDLDVIETNTIEYTKQPTSLAEVQLLIANYNLAIANTSTEEELINVNLPRFEFEVDSALIPEGYYCSFVENDEFGTNYYTLTVKHSLFTNGVWGGGDGSSEEQAYLIEDAEDLMILADTISTTQHYTDTYFKLTANIDISGINWKGIGYDINAYFGGHFDGQGYVIQGLHGTNITVYYGLFGCIAGATIKNLTIEMFESTTFKGFLQVGCLVGRVGSPNVDKKTLIENCTIEGNNATISGSGVAGGLVGVINYSGTTTTTHRVYINNCAVKNLTVIGSSQVGGVFGRIDQATVTNIIVENTNVTGSSYVGGFVGIISGGINSYSEVINCSTKGHGNIQASDNVGGFAGAITGYSQVMNSFSQFDVNSSYMVAGGFAGSIYDYANVINCYSIGSVSKNNTAAGGYLGSFSGKIYGYAKVSNSYATGLLNYNNSNDYLGGFTSELASTTTVTNCYYDTTTTQQSSAVGNTTNHTIIGLSTKDMIHNNKYGFAVTDNTNGKANGGGSVDNPWYIDQHITYPYLYYQYENYMHEEVDYSLYQNDNRIQEEVDYSLNNLLYSDGLPVGQKRADFTINSVNLPLKVKSSGAAKVYFPYSGTSLYDINTSNYTDIPGAENNENLWSLGSVSNTGIIAFDGVPYAEKTSNRNSLHKDGKTYVGDTITYTITLYNYSSEADYIKPILIENIPDGLTLITKSIRLKVGDNEDEQVVTTDSSTLPYYSYDNSDLIIYLNDMLSLNNMLRGSDENGFTYYTITFDVYVEKEAASIFYGDGSYTGDIQNSGIVTGDLQYTDDDVIIYDYESSFDDKNKNPVYDVFVLRIYKTDLENKELEGAIFSLYTWNGIDNQDAPDSEKLVTPSNIVTDTNSEGWYLYKGDLVSGSAGWVSEVQLFNYSNYYQLVETIAPEGFMVPSQQWRLYLNNDATNLEVVNILDTTTNEESIALTKISDSTKGTYYHLINQEEVNLGSITLEKYNQDGSIPLEEATFLIEKEVNGEFVYISWDDENNQWIENSQNGFTQSTILNQEKTIASAVFYNLPLGKYRITEISPPSDEYMPLVDSIIVDIPTINNEGQPMYDVTFSIYNNQLLELPEAGRQFNDWGVLCFGLFVLLSAVALYMLKRQLNIDYKKRKRRII